MGDPQLGFFGKLPTQGDFVRRRVSGGFLAVWDPWLRSVIDAARQSLGDHWLATYLTSPVWRFAATARVCGEHACVGVVMPSVDAVGRYFPLTLVAETPEPLDPFRLVADMADWFAQVEELALSVLDEDPAFDLDAFDMQTEALGSGLAAMIPVFGTSSFSLFDAMAAGGAHYDLPSMRDFSAMLPGLLSAGLAQSAGPYSLWWTVGSDQVRPGWFATPSLPAANRFTAAMDGQWRQHGWRSESIRPIHPRGETNANTPGNPGAGPTFRSAGVSDVGKVRKRNEDSMLEMPERGLWVVADGVGGQDAGDRASRMLTDSLRQAQGGDLQTRVNNVRQNIESVHDHLRHLAMRPVDPIACASTIVALVAGAGGCAFLWAGDSRIYRLRDGRLERCTRDHSLVQAMVDGGCLAAEDAPSHSARNVITRAVGGDTRFEVDIAYADLHGGDRFLLCSDGVHGSLDDDTIADLLRQGSCQTACVALVDLVLARGAPDNTTAVVVDARDSGAGSFSPGHEPP